MTFLVCHNLLILSDFVDLDLGKQLTMTVALLETLATDLLEYEHLVCSCGIIENGSLYNGTFYIGSSDLDCSLILNEEDLVELNISTFGLRKSLDKDFISSFNFELLACNVYDCVHK